MQQQSNEELVTVTQSCQEIADVCVSVLSVCCVETLKHGLLSSNSLCRHFLYVVGQQLVLFFIQVPDDSLLL